MAKRAATPSTRWCRGPAGRAPVIVLLFAVVLVACGDQGETEPSQAEATPTTAVTNPTTTGAVSTTSEAPSTISPVTTTTAPIGVRVAADYPAVDGSTSTHPLQRTIACEVYELACEWVLTGIDPNNPRVILPTAEAARKAPEPAEVVNGISHNGTHGSYVNLIEKKADLILVAREPSPDELAAADTAGVTLDVQPVALDAFVFVTHADAPVHDLPLETIRQIYAGSITHWDMAAPGAPHEPITTYMRNDNSGSQELMKQLVMKGTPMIEATPDILGPTMAFPISRLSTDEVGIGYSVFFYAEHIFPEPDVTMFAVDGVLPTAATIADGSYPLVTEVYVVVRQDTPSTSTPIALRDWLPTKEGQAAVAKSGYVPLP